MQNIRIDISKPIYDLTISNGIDQCELEICIEDITLGVLCLPVCDNHISAWVLRDAISISYAWQILGHHFARTHYSREIPSATDANIFEDVIGRYHDEHGWHLFLQEFWNIHDWDVDDFYNPGKDSPEAEVMNLQTPFVELDVIRPLPNIIVNAEAVKILFSIAGSGSELMSVHANEGSITAQQLRAFITTNCGFDLCRLAVREALIGRGYGKQECLHILLQQSAQSKNPVISIADREIMMHSDEGAVITSQSIVLGRRKGLWGTNVNHRSILSSANAGELLQMATVAKEPIIQVPKTGHPDRVVYLPDIVVQNGDEHHRNNYDISGDSHVFDRQHFESLFSRQPDPWKYTHPYEEVKYLQSWSLIPNKRFSSALEIACAEGHFTQKVAPLADKFTAADISDIALKRAAERCSSFRNIEFTQLDVFKETLPSQYEIIFCSEVLYFAKDISALHFAARNIFNALSEGGYFITAHAHLVIDEPDKPGYDWAVPFGAKTISDTFLSLSGCKLLKEIRTPLYRVQLFQKKKAGADHNVSTEYVTMEQPTEIPDRVKNTVRWNGGAASEQVYAQLTTNKVPVLMYHRIAPEGSETMSRYRVTPQMFERQLKYLKDCGYQTLSWPAWARARNLRQPVFSRSIIITFDDGYTDFYSYAWPLLDKYGFDATVFVVSGLVGKHNVWDEAYNERIPLMDWQQIIELDKAGIQFGSHSATHQKLTGLSPVQVVSEGVSSRTILQQKLGKSIDVFAYPYGDTNGCVSHLVGACGYNIGVTTEQRRAMFQDDILNVPRIEIKGSDSFEDFVLKISA